MNIVFSVGLYFGTEKPMDSNDFLKDFVNEATHLVSNGIMIKNYTYKVVIDIFCCDIPAKAFILKIKGHNGFFHVQDAKLKESKKRIDYVFLTLIFLIEKLKELMIIILIELIQITIHQLLVFHLL